MALINYPPIPSDDEGNLDTLSSLGHANGLSCCTVDNQIFQATKTYLMALILKAISGGQSDYTDWCALAADLKQFDHLPDYEQRSAYLQMLIMLASEAGVTNDELSQESFRKALSCWCCSVRPNTMFSMEIFLLSKILHAFVDIHI